MTSLGDHLPAQYHSQLHQKKQKILENFHFSRGSDIDVFPSLAKYYRMRAEFRIWHQGARISHSMFTPNTKKCYPITHFPAGSQLMNTLMEVLNEQISQVDILRNKLFRIDYLTSLSGEALVTLLYHCPLDALWQEKVSILREMLQKQGFQVDFIGRSRKQKIVVDRDFILEKLNIQGRTYTFKQVENGFTQPNAYINQCMINWVKSLTPKRDDDLLELYCGSGNFSIPLAEHYRQVLATEVSKPAVAAAQYNIEANRVNNVTIVRLSAQELTQALAKKRHFRRLAQVDLTQYQYKTLLIDPPRCGLDTHTLDFAKGFEQIIYISCNLNTLKENLNALKQTHYIEKCAFFDQFPYTEHIEMGIFLKKR